MGLSKTSEKWDKAQEALKEFREKIESLGPDYAGIGAVSYTAMAVTSATATANDDPIVAVQFIIALLECLKHTYGWGEEQVMAVVLRAMHSMGPGQSDSSQPGSTMLS